MKKVDEKKFHRLYGKKIRRVNYQSDDFGDYALMVLLCGLVMYITYGANQIFSMVTFAMCAFMVITFPLRHGMRLAWPILLKRPQEIIFAIVHKMQNLRLVYLLALGILLLENYAIFLTPDLPHRTELMREIAMWLFWIHFASITAYRTYIFFCHLLKKEHVRTVLMESVWKNLLLKQKNMTLHIWHAYFTGILTHLAVIAPWYLVITYLNFSIYFLPVICALNLLTLWLYLKTANEIIYREHWLGHNMELDFVYAHGPHHDAIPSAMIGTSGTGILEGFFRIVSFPNPFYNPLVAMFYYTLEITFDIYLHQYIPGVFPGPPRSVFEVVQHSRHHFGKVEPYGLSAKLVPSTSPEGLKGYNFLPDEFRNSAMLDEQLNGFKWNNREQNWYLNLVDKYSQNR